MNLNLRSLRVPKRHSSVLLMGHKGAGKSKFVRQIRTLTGEVDEQIEDKIELRETTLAFKSSNYKLLDASITCRVSRMIEGGFEADIGVVVIGATNFQEFRPVTRGQCQLAKSCGLSKLILVVNKMDHPSLQCSKQRFDEIVAEFLLVIEGIGYTQEDVAFLPVVERVTEVCLWWTGSSFLELLDSIRIVPEGDPEGPFRMTIFRAFHVEENDKRRHVVVSGRVESGKTEIDPSALTITHGDVLQIRPNTLPAYVPPSQVLSLWYDEETFDYAVPRHDIKVHLRFGVPLDAEEEALVFPGRVLSGSPYVPAVSRFFAHVKFIAHEWAPDAVYSAGSVGFLHVHGLGQTCVLYDVARSASKVYKGSVRTRPCGFVKGDEEAVCEIRVSTPISLEKFSDVPRLGRLVLTQVLTQDVTVGVGKVIALDVEGTVRDLLPLAPYTE